MLQAYLESGAHQSEGATQPWIQAFLYQLARMLDTRHIMELGTWHGATSAWLACALHDNGGGTLTLVDNAQDSLTVAEWRANSLGFPDVTVVPVHAYSHEFLPEMPTDVTLVFMDDDKQDIPGKVAWMRGRMARGVIVLHDAETVRDAVREAGGVYLKVPDAWAGGDVALIGVP